MLRSDKPMVAVFLLLASASAASAQSAPAKPAATPTAVSAAGVTLHSTGVTFPESNRTFAGSAAKAVNDGCLICHSASMVLTQPVLSKAAWRAEVDKMVAVYKAPIAGQDLDAISDYLASLQLTAPPTVYQQETARAPDPQHGAVIAAQGTPNGTPACTQCHAQNGASDGSGAFPRMAGQVQHYMREQMRDFASAVRNNAIMSPFAQALSADDTADVIAYYAGASAPLPPLVPPNPALMQRGEKLAQNGDPSRNIPACEDCHGPRGAGQAPVIPYLAGQYAQYITAELHAWQDGSRNNSPAVMAAFAKKLTGDDIDALAAYYQALAATAPVAAAK